jgi:deoxyxylulose-5-phosphate synthase
VLIGGFGWAIKDYYSKTDAKVKVVSLGVDDKFVKNGSYEKQYEDNGLNIKNLDKIAKELVLSKEKVGAYE